MAMNARRGVIAVAAMLALTSLAACRNASAPAAAASSARADEKREPVAAGDLPDQVIAAVRSHRRASLVTATKVTSGGKITYDLTVTGTRKTHLVVEPDGTVIRFE